MKTKIKTAILSLLLLGAIALQAQEKYEFATVTQNGNVELQISVEGKILETRPLSKDVKTGYDHKALFEYISRMQDDGWQVFNITPADKESLTFILRKRILR